jgi:small subunit ribosomal protein S20
MTKNKSAMKKIRVAERNRLRNKSYKTRAKNSMKLVMSHVTEGNIDKAKEAYILAQKHLDKACINGVIHKNKAARHKSKLSSLIASYIN